MCRILLFFGNPKQAFLKAFIEISRRDRTLGLSHGSGWGMLYARKGEYGLYKSTKPIWESYIDPPTGYKLYLLHSRLASVGGVSPANTHPIVYGDFAIAHNGTFRKEEMAEDLKKRGIDITTGGATDTELFLKAFVDSGGDVKALVELSKWAIRYLDKEEPMMNIAIVDLRNAEAYFVTYRVSEEPHYVPVYRIGEIAVIASEPLDEEPWSPLPNGSIAKIANGVVNITKVI
mgnify:CR=1 FL=1